VIVTIHQPDFLPWFGLFRKIAHADLWIVLDHVKNNPRDAAFWGRRVRVLVNGSPQWLSITLKRPATPGMLGIPIREMELNFDDPSMLERAWTTIRMAYARAPYFKHHSDLIESYFRNPEPLLAKRNLQFICEVMGLLQIRTPLLLSSTLGLNSKGSELLIDLIKTVNADIYLHGMGASTYQQDQLFLAANITLRANDFAHPVYSQLRSEEFVPGLSIIDMLFNAPIEDIRRWVLD
jgi:hypothetical protein